MSDVKRMKIMKKLFYSVLALAGILAVSCNKVIEKEVTPVLDTESVSTHTVTIHAGFDALTRTAYANDKTFSWVKGDTIQVYTVNAETDKARIAKLVAQESGASVDFAGEVEDGFELSSIAFYTAANSWIDWDENDVYFYLPGTTAIDDDSYTFSVESGNPMSNVPLIGVEDSDGVFHFTTATGVLKFNLTDLPAEAAYFELTADDGNMLQGYFAVDFENYQINRDGGKEGTYTYTDKDGKEQTARYSYSNLFYKFTPDADGKATIYVPVPVGTLGQGAEIEILDADGKTIFSKKTKKDITISRNKITELTALSCKIEWVSLGKGMFGDHYHFNADYDQEVEIQQNAAEPAQFRLVDPYAGYREIMEYEPTGEEYGPDDYLYFTVLQKGDKVSSTTVTLDDLVWFEDYYTGIIDDNYGVDPALVHPSSWTSFKESDWARSIVVKYQADGITPANIQLAPVFYWLTDPEEGSGYWTGYSNTIGMNNLIEIRFPGAERVDLTVSLSYVEIVDSNPEQAIALIDFECSSAITGAKIVIAANEEDAKTALADASRYTAVTESGEYEVKMPANAPSGDFFIYAQTTVTEGLTPACPQLVVSNSFKYFNANDDKGYKIDDVIGSYSADDYYNLGNNWYQTTLTMVVEESDDPLNGDIMITSLCPEILSRYGDTETGALYASFNTATGEITVTAGQVIAHNEGSDIDWTVADYPETQDLHLVLTDPGHILNEGNYCFYAGSYGLQTYSNAGIEFVRTTDSTGGSGGKQAPGVFGRKATLSQGGKMGRRSYAPATPAIRPR